MGYRLKSIFLIRFYGLMKIFHKKALTKKLVSVKNFDLSPTNLT
jgi:hypothetical protein